MAEEPQPSTSSASVAPSDEGVVAADATVSFDDLYGDCEARHLNVTEIASMWNITKLVRELGTREQCVEFAIQNELVDSVKMCRVHKIPMKISYTQNKNVGSFVCNKGACRARSRVARGKGTWFDNIKISLPRVFYLMYCFAHRRTYREVIHEDPEKSEEGCLSMATVSAWYSYCRETVVKYQTQHQDGESKFGKRKERGTKKRDVILELKWRRWVRKNKFDPFVKLIECIKNVYVINT